MATEAGFDLDLREFRAFVRNAKSRTPRMLATAVNRSGKSAKTAMVKAVREDVGGLKAKDVRGAIGFRNARPSHDPVARIITPQKRLSLIRFGAVQLKRAGVRTRLKSGTTTIKGAFIAQGRGGGRQVFKRTAGARLPIYKLFGPSLARPFARHWPTVGARRYREQITKEVASGMARMTRR